MSLQPRIPQQQAIARTIEEYDSGRRAVLVVQATGTGKTVVAAHIGDYYLPAGRVLFLAHRDELIRQAANKLQEVTGHVPDFEKGEEWAAENSLSGKARVIISSFQTQNSSWNGQKRMHRFNPLDFSLLVADEAHHLLAPSYRAVIDYYMHGNLNLRLLGLTATADRADGEGLGKIFESVSFSYELPDAVNDGYLCHIRGRRVIIDGLDLSRCRLSGGDLDPRDVEAAVLVEKPLHGVAHAMIEVACGLPRHCLAEIREDPNRIEILADWLKGKPRKKTLGFTVGVKHAERTAEIINRWIPGSASYVCGTGKHVGGSGMSMDVRREHFKAFSNGDIQFLLNCNVATEGYDEPGIEIISMSRFTKSRNLYAQMGGRGTRPLKHLAEILGTLPSNEARRAAIASSAKPHIEILDFVGNTGRHRLVSATDLLGGAEIEDAVIERAKELCLDDCIDVEEALKQAAVDVAAEQEKMLRQAQDEFELAALEAERVRLADAAKRACVVGTTNYHISDVDALGRYHTTAPREATPGARIVAPPSQNQIKMLVGLGVAQATAEGYSGKQAWAVIDSLKKKRCTERQGHALWRMGYSNQEISGMNFSQASAAIETAKGGKVGAA